MPNVAIGHGSLPFLHRTGAWILQLSCLDLAFVVSRYRSSMRWQLRRHIPSILLPDPGIRESRRLRCAADDVRMRARHIPGLGLRHLPQMPAICYHSI
jgi:hypothetical protein